MGRSRAAGRCGAEAHGLSDILAGHPADAELLAALYDAEHDEVRDDLAFYREWTARSQGAVLDLGCGSGRLFGSFIAGGASRIVGVDGSPALLARARRRIIQDEQLSAAAKAGRIELVDADIRDVIRPDRFALVALAGVVSHLDGAREAARALAAAAAMLVPGGELIVDGLGPGALPRRDLPLSVDWRRVVDGMEVVRRSRLARHEIADGLRVHLATIADVAYPDGTIARLPASFRLWYPSPGALLELVEAAGLSVTATYGSHDLEPLGPESERCIVVAAAERSRGRG